MEEYYEQGSVLVVPDPHEAKDRRPVLVLSDIHRPALGQKYTIVTITSQEHLGERPYALSIPYTAIEEGRLTDQRGSYVCPWATFVLDDEDIHKRVAQLSDDFMAEVAEAYHEMIHP